jgi:hypothetical protein
MFFPRSNFNQSETKNEPRQPITHSTGARVSLAFMRETMLVMMVCRARLDTVLDVKQILPTAGQTAALTSTLHKRGG